MQRTEGQGVIAAMLTVQAPPSRNSRPQLRTMATSNKTETTPLLLTEIRDKFQTLKYKLLDDTPCLMELDYTGNIYVHKNGLLSKDDVMKRLSERPNWNRDEKVLSTTLRGSGSGEYKFYLCYVPTDFVESREKLDSLLADEWEFAEPADNVLEPSEIGTVDKIYFTEALERFHGEIWFVEDPSKPDVPAADDKLLQKSLFDLFGPAEGDDDDGRVSFRNFRQLFFDGNDMYGTAERGDRYFVFYYQTG
ncbi:unnamed protein product [Cyprideis torosa]|uniref:Uncharacterized protein n=1 Tax=Cyprideis torosa TaxID=163714 RepID=A0A7R8W899_9CRUS|nr:unnamed protein product [Cyprideis torosa]CAG0887267.1 unnamed protein product [Cyprideis torosa]